SRRRHTSFSRDWSSDVCSSDLNYGPQVQDIAYGEVGASRTRGYLETPTPGARNVSLVADGPPAEAVAFSAEGGLIAGDQPVTLEIGRASCRERGQEWLASVCAR